jgi:putative ABC transport system substrate-binding protein
VTARAQQSTMPVIGFLGSASAAPIPHLMTAFRQGLGEGGYVEGRNVAIEYRWADNQYDRLPDMAADLVRRHVDVIVASGGPVSALAAKAATAVIPIVFTASSDPVKLGLVSSFNRPSGNVTGSAMLTAELEPKRLEVLRELAPTARVIGALINPGRSDAEAQSRSVQDAGRALGLPVVILRASREPEIEVAFAGLAAQGIAAIMVGADPFFNSLRAKIVALAARYTVPGIYMNREFVEAGGLASYGTSIAGGYRQAGIYAARILKGAKPGDLPVMQPTKFELVINLKTAKALNLTVTREFLLRTDEVIE